MRKIFYHLLAFLVAFSIQSSAQYFQASVVIDGSNPASTKLRIKIKPVGGDLTNFQFDGMEYFLRKPSGDDATTFGTIINNTTDFPGLDITKGGGGAQFMDGYASEANFTNFYFYGKNSGATTAPMTYLNGMEYEVFNVDISTAGSSNFEFAANNISADVYYLTLSRKSDPNGKPDYTATGTNGNLANHLFYGPGTTQVGDNYYQKPGILLPVKFLSFYALKAGDDAKLSWTVASDDQNKYFDIERSINGRGFTSFARVNALDNGKAINSYEATDLVISKNGSKDLYYRIKQVDKSGSSIYSLVRNLNLEQSSLGISLFPNPARSSSKLIVDAPAASKAIVILRDNAGKQHQVMNVQFVKGINQKDINVSSLPAGDYNLSVVSENLNKTIKLSKLN